MSWTLAITGKGGVGKTTFAALAIRLLGEQGRGPILAVDADPNTCLDALLGVNARCTVGSVREETRRFARSGDFGGMSKQELLDLKIQECLVEAQNFDLIAMGRPEGPGCYCYANNVLRGVLERLADQYPAMVIDNEAGLENLSRRTVQKVNWLVFAADPSARGLATARRLFDLAQEMEMKAAAMGLIVNRVHDEAWKDRAKRLFHDTSVELLGTLPDDEEVARRDAEGHPVWELPADNPVYRAAETILERVTLSATCNA